MAGSHEKVEKFPDLRHQFLRGLIQYEGWQRTRHYLKSAAECTSRAIVSLELSPQPIKSPRQAQKLESIGGETIKRLKKFAEEDRWPRSPPLSGKFVSSAGAILVALMTAEDQIKESSDEKDSHHISEEKLKAQASMLCEEDFTQDGFCQAWWRMEVLIKRGYVKRRFYKKSPVYHLLPEGREVALTLLGKSCAASTGTNGNVSKHSLYLPKAYPELSTRQSMALPEKSVVFSPGTSGCFMENLAACDTEIATTSTPPRSETPTIECSYEKSGYSKEKVRPRKSLSNNEINVKLCTTSTESHRSGNNWEGTRSSHLPWQCDQMGTDCRLGNDTGQDGVVMLLDTSEWGGEQGNLIQLGEMLDNAGMIYRTKRLVTGDYCWRWRYHGEERVLPCMVERKRADDLARTLKEGRFWSQVQKMVDWKKEFMTCDFPCDLFYVIEGEPEQYVMNCKDRCHGVGMCKNPSLTQVKNAIVDLKSHPDLQVLHTDSILETVAILESITVDLDQKVKKGKFDVMFEMEWEKCKQDSGVINIDDSDEEAHPSASKGKPSTDGKEPSVSENLVSDKLCKNSNDSIIRIPHCNIDNFYKTSLTLSENDEHDVDHDDLDAQICVIDNDGDMEDPDWLPDIPCSTWTHRNMKTTRCSSEEITESNASRTKHNNLKRNIKNDQDEGMFGKKILVTRKERSAGFGVKDGLCSGSYKSCDCVEIDPDDDWTQSKNVSLRNHVVRSTSKKTTQLEASDDSESVETRDDWWENSEKEPLVMYHNSYGFQPRTPSKNKEEKPMCINKIDRQSEMDREIGYKRRSSPKLEVNKQWVTESDRGTMGFCKSSDYDKDRVTKIWDILPSQSKETDYDDDKVTQIQDMFPSLSREAVYDVMSRHSGDVMSCVEELLKTQEIG
ncbi:uncharacterized protein LOC133197644 [Saccostrea echinata]|uniref:uncharacterized protein LOC133197644 n=1 Tax=Saccostrea echinata TaxID=191078 RepID=UPI002A8003F2|nr:uncharacterized protein LOC133197644 [Saccostrea echinata]